MIVHNVGQSGRCSIDWQHAKVVSGFDTRGFEEACENYQGD